MRVLYEHRLAAGERWGGLYTRDIFHEYTSQDETDGSCRVRLEELSAARVLDGGNSRLTSYRGACCERCEGR